MINPITVDTFAAPFNCGSVGRASNYDGPDLKLFILVDIGIGALSSVAWSTGAQLMIFCFRFTAVLFDSPEISNCLATLLIGSPSLLLYTRVVQ